MDNLPFSLQQISPTLAAAHTIRLRRLNSDWSLFNESHCPRCGTFNIDGSSNTRSGKHAMTRTCRFCGFVHKFPLVQGNATLFPRRNKGARPKQIIHDPVPPAGPSEPFSARVVPTIPKVKSRNKKSRLQEMLARKQEQEKKWNSQSERSLTSFLSSL
jgi:predicted RNA-binding Zn-ribbon protein involved in translation (DUF1610 family)